MASLIITCPNCKHQFEPGDSMRDEIEKELRSKMLDWQKKKDDEFRSKELSYQQQLQNKDEEINKRLAVEKQKIQTELQVSITKNIAADFENKLQLLQESDTNNKEKLK